MKLYNTLTRKKEDFKPLQEEVGLYTCGPTVYDYIHIGNMRTYLFEDVLKRTFLYNGYKVKHVMNITDVGHLSSDADTGKDKIEESAKKKKKTAAEITEYYTEAFKKDIKELNIKDPDIYIKATETIEEQIELIKILEEKGYTYITEGGVYFDTSKLEDYGKMANLEKIEAGKRVQMGEKKNPTDFALWKFSKPEEKRQMEWDSPWKRGFPGWHTECVVMAKKCLGIPFDIHCGGIDHVEIHHPNEIAQAEAAYGENLARFWMHGEFLNLKDQKMSKSKGGTITVSALKEDGFSPLAYRYLVLNSHYRSKLNFSKEGLEGAQNSLYKLKEKVLNLKKGGKIIESYQKKFLASINDDLNTPKALETLWALLKDEEEKEEDKRETIESFDEVFGLDLAIEDDSLITPNDAIPEEINELIKDREKARKEKDFQKADLLREKVEDRGYMIEDTKNGVKIRKKPL